MKLPTYTYEVTPEEDYSDLFDEFGEGLGDDIGIDLSLHRDYKPDTFTAAAPIDLSEFMYWYNDTYRRSEPEHEWDETENEEYEQFMKDYHWTFVYMYDHSGRTISTSPFGCRWDSGTAGIAFFKKSQFREWFSESKNWSEEQQEEKATEWLNSFVEELDDLFVGRVYCWTVYKNGEFFDSCNVYVGKNGEVEAKNDAKNVIESSIKRDMQNYQSIIKTLIRARVPLTHRQIILEKRHV